MLRAFAFPLSYQPHVEKELEAAIRRVGLDVALRAHDDNARFLHITVIDESEIADDFTPQHGTLVVLLLEHDGRRVLEVCAKCGLDRQRAEFYAAACYPLAGYSDDGIHYPPPSEAHEFMKVLLPPDPATATATYEDRRV